MRPGLKVLFMTGYTRNAIVHHGRLDAGVHLIGKPFSFDELAAKVRGAIGRFRDDRCNRRRRCDDARAAPAPRSSSHFENLRGRMAHILVVDDEPLIAMLAEDWLLEMGH